MENYHVIETEIQSLIEHEHIEVPILPEVAGKAVRLAQHPDSTATNLAKLIQSDQSLAGHVMRVANSAAYSPNGSIQTLQQAITRLGMKLIAEIALAASINSSLFDTPGYDDHIHFELKFSLASALWSKETARACRANVEAAFLSGLLHDIGRPVAIQSILRACEKHHITLSREDVFALENTFQNQIGARVVEQWEMPITVKEVLTYFNKYKEPHNCQSLTMIVIGGSQLAAHMLCEDGPEGCLSQEQMLATEIFPELNLYPDDVQALLDKKDIIQSAMDALEQS